ncbi:myotubularin-related protein 10-A isoform X1 [Amyelois transitella]|uniref:myotubularin-related protein 10-A isoform X1 n=1 Tax=Amyelois transitella TaxID=680683 RepID=UPI00299017F0|nr:myotubularin-related protein 10-A isoform X1 [Amyelois transitella]
MITMSEKLPNFTSYINSPKNNGEKNGSLQEVKPKLLNGELVVGAAHNVIMLTPLSERDQGRMGSLFVTNYKLSFVPLEHSPYDESCQRNYLLGPHDVPLTGVGAIWMTDGGPVRRRRVGLNGDMPEKVKGLQVICKNMKVLTFSFVNSSKGNGRKIAMALVHHAFPKRHHLLFAFEYKEPYYRTLPLDLNMFDRPADWRRELERCDCPHWRITPINATLDAFMLTASPTLIVPNSSLDCNLIDYARHFKNGRIPIWVWGREEGAALLRSGELLPTDLALKTECVLFEQVRRIHPKLTPPRVIYLCGNSFTNSPSPNTLPPLGILQASYKKLAELCTPTTLGGFWIQDSQYYSILDSSRWLRYVANCLAFADEAADHLSRNVTVVLQEGDGVDYCAVVSSLTQLLVDPYFRTISGFQSLIQKEWVALGHPFCDRFGLPRPGSSAEASKDATKTGSAPQSAPVFLLFLDCVWQLTNQFPAHFQFTETYLTTLWDCAHNHVFDTFLFNCPRDRDLPMIKFQCPETYLSSSEETEGAISHASNTRTLVANRRDSYSLRIKNFIQRPVWDWSEQFSEQDKALFYNPLFSINKTPNTPKQRISQTSLSMKTPELSRLEPCTSIAGMELWSQCYERWLLPLDAMHSGVIQYHIHNYAVLKEIQQLNEKLSQLSIMANRQSNGTETSDSNRTVVSRFYPFSAGRRDALTGTLDSMQVSLIDASQLLDSQSLLNAPD